MIFSCLVDADFLATERFYHSVGGPEADRIWPDLGRRIDGLLAAFDAHMAAKRDILGISALVISGRIASSAEAWIET